MNGSQPSGGFWRRWRGPPLAFQILGLLIGGLVVAQLVTLFLTMVLPPSPPSTYGLNDIAAELRGEAAAADGGVLQRIVQAGPPDLSGPGWLVSERSRHELAMLLGVSDGEVSLSFFTPLPFAGSALPPPGGRMANDGLVPALSGVSFGGFDTPPARLILAQVQAGPPLGAFPPGALLSRLPPGQSGAIGNGPPPRDALPPGIPPAGAVPPGAGRLPPGRREGIVPPGAGLLPPRAGSLYAVDPSPLRGGVYIPGDGGAAVPPLLQTPAVNPQATLPSGALPSTEQTETPFIRQGLIGTQGIVPFREFREAARVGSFADEPGYRRFAPPAELRDSSRPFQELAPPVPAPALPPLLLRPAPTIEAPVATYAPLLPGLSAPAPTASPAPPAALLPEQPPTGPPIAVTPPSRGLFGLAPAPFVEGDFVAALRMPDGRWSVVQPAAEPFPNAWQRRLLLWFMVAFAVVAPLGWLFARRLVKPLAGFAYAAERLGRDPAGAVIALDGPAEMGRAARAFNLMQGRLRSFVDDRTAMVGAISHDLRTPLTRLRFRIEDVPDDQREGMLEEVAEMEAMISSVLDFIRDASTPNARERMDLRTLVDDVIEDAVMIGSDVTMEKGGEQGAATVEVDVLGMRRVLDNLLENAVKYGARARIRLRTEPDSAVAEIFDDGPGLPDDELERVFEPFYRSEAALNSGARGSGLGLAVCRSITRAHGGDVRLLRSAEGFMAQLRVPLAA